RDAAVWRAVRCSRLDRLSPSDRVSLPVAADKFLHRRSKQPHIAQAAPTGPLAANAVFLQERRGQEACTRSNQDVSRSSRSSTQADAGSVSPTRSDSCLRMLGRSSEAQTSTREHLVAPQDWAPASYRND